MSWKVGDPCVDACHCGRPKHVKWANCNDCLNGCDYCRKTPGGFVVKSCSCCGRNILGHESLCNPCLQAELLRKLNVCRFVLKLLSMIGGPAIMGLNLGICGIGFGEWKYWILFATAYSWGLATYFFGRAEERSEALEEKKTP